MIKTALNYNWQFKEGFDLNDIKTAFEGESVDLPHTHKKISKNYFNEDATKMISTYQKAFSYPIKTARRLFLNAQGIMSKATLYLNGEKLTTHIGGFTAFRVELTTYLQKDNLLTMKVDAKETPDHPPFGHVVDYLTYGGIYREIELVETGLEALDYLLIDGDQKMINIRAKANGINPEAECIFKIYDKENLIHTFKAKKQGGMFSLSESHQLNLWQLENPKLYTVKAFINRVCVYEDRFGLRKIHVDKDHFYLNGEKIFLRGLNRHQSYPYVGFAMPKSAQVKDVDILKDDLQINMVRSSHYPPSQHFLDRCDEKGLLVFTELPGWQHIGDETWQKHALEDLKSMVIHDYNHPSIVIIGTRINESPDHDRFYQKTQALVKAIDKTRPTSGVRFTKRSHLLEDIYAMNDFTHRGDNAGLSEKRKITDKNHPYLISEHNGHMFPTKAFDHDEKRIEHALRHFKVLDDAYQMEGLMGVLGWCMNDYNTHRAFGSNDHICYHGVLDMNRNPKYAAAVYASQGDKPYLKVLSNMHIGDRASSELKQVVVASNCDKVELYKNDAFIGVYYPNRAYQNLPHPPFIIRDFIGQQIEQQEAFSPTHAKRIKRIMLYMLNHNLKMRLRDKIRFAYILFKYKLKYEDAVKLYTTYVGGWGEQATTYTFKGYHQSGAVLTEQKGSNDDYTLSLNQDADTLYHRDTYDVTRLSVELSNAFGERAFYSNEAITIKVKGDIQLMGPKTRSLQGGIESFWVRSTKAGQGEITIQSPHYPACHATLKIESG